MLARTLFIVALCGGATISEAASFPCEKAQSRIEKMICADPELSTLDTHLGNYYEGAKLRLQEGADCLKADQRNWLKSVRNVCPDKACLKRAYLDRLTELDPFQAGATTVKNLPFTQKPPLVWVIPPAADNVATPDNPNAEPLEVKGSLVNEIATGDGIVLRTARGESYLLVPLMFFDGETTIRLPVLAQYAKTTYLVRGYGDKDETGHRFFEPSRCIFIYRLPDP